MFRIRKYRDKFNREYQIVNNEEATVSDPRKFYFEEREKIKKIHLLTLTYNCDDYLKYCLEATKNQVNSVYAVDNGSIDNTLDILEEYSKEHITDTKKGDLSYLANRCLDMIPKNSWVFYVNPDEILFDLPDNYLGALANYLENNKIYCGDPRFPDFVYNYGTLLGQFDWGEGPGNYWTARRLFYYTGNEQFINKTHYNISNIPKDKLINRRFQPNNEHTGEWKGTVIRIGDVALFHYGKLRGIEKQRGKGSRLLNGEHFAKGTIATIPYRGKHPSVMGL